MQSWYEMLCATDAYNKVRAQHTYVYATAVLDAVFAIGNITLYWAEIDEKVR